MTDTSTDQIVEQLPTGAERPPISKKLRFEVFKRDSFTCQYCGRRAPDVVLHCDHVKPLVEGGEHTILNLTTACVDCNLGKGPRELSDQAVLSKQLNQLAALQERKEQMEMMIEWQKQLSSLDELPITNLGEQWSDATGYSWTDTGKTKVRKLINRFGVEIVAKAMQTSLGQYLEHDETGTATAESIEKCFDGMCAISKVEHAELREPGTKRMYLIRGGLRRRFYYCNDSLCLSLMKTAARNGVSLDYIEEVANTSQNWSQFRNAMEAVIAECQQEAQAEAEWRAEVLKVFERFRKNVSDDAIIRLVLRALKAGISEKHLTENSIGCEWHVFKEYFEFSISWRNRLIEPLRSALGGYLPDDHELGYVHEALRLGLAEHCILETAQQTKNWPQVKETLIEAIDTLEQVELQRFREEATQNAPTT